MIPVAGYCRVSTDHTDQANSFESQQRFFREYIAAHPDWELYSIYADEGVTGTSTKKRTQFNRMMDDAWAGRFRLILTKEVSRFSRNVLDTIRCTRELKSIGVGVLFLTDRINTMDPEAEMLLSLFASLAQEESRKTSARVVWGQTRQMERGVVFGRSMLGYDVKDGKMHIDPEGAELVRLIFHKYAVEQMGTSQIARFLTEQGYRTRRGNPDWKSSAIIRILKNEKYAGDLVQKKTYTPDYLTHERRRNAGQVPLIVIENHHEPIISRRIWELTRDRLRRNNKHRAGEGGHSNRHVFSGRIKCSRCGSSFAARYRTHRDGIRRRRWCCASAGCGIGKILRDDDALQMLKTAVRHLPMDHESMVRDVTSAALEAILAGQTAARDDARRLLAEMDRAEQKKQAVLDRYFAGEISKPDMQAMCCRYSRQIDELRRRAEETARRGTEKQDTAGLRDQIRGVIEAILTGEAESGPFYKNVLDRITVFEDRHLELRLQGLPHIFRFTG